MACTATATPKVAEEIVARLGLSEPERVRSGLRPPEPLLRRPAVRRRGLGGAQARDARRRRAAWPRTAPRSSTAARASRTEETARAAQPGGPEHRRLPRRAARRRAHPRAGRVHARARRTSSSPPTRSGWASTRPTCARSGTGRSRPRSRPTTRRPAARAATAQPGARRPARARAATSAASSASSARPRSPSSRSARSSTACARQGDDRSSTPSEDKDRILLAVAERAGALTLAPGRGQPRPASRSPPGRLDRGTDRPALPRRDRPPLAVLPQRSSTTRPPGTAAGAASCSTTSATRRPARPTGRCCDVHDPPDWLPPITAAKPKKLAAGRRRPARLRRRARAAEGLAPRPRRRQARLHGRDRRDAARGDPPQAAHRAGAAADQGHRRVLHHQARRLAAGAARDDDAAQ